MDSFGLKSDHDNQAVTTSCSQIPAGASKSATSTSSIGHLLSRWAHLIAPVIAAISSYTSCSPVVYAAHVLHTLCLFGFVDGLALMPCMSLALLCTSFAALYQTGMSQEILDTFGAISVFGI